MKNILLTDGDSENNQRHDHPSAGGDGEGGSWTGWAWNVGSSVGSFLLPVYWEDEETDTDLTPLDARREKIFHVGFYVDSASLAVKVTERQKEKSLFGSTKLRFSPFLRLDLSGRTSKSHDSALCKKLIGRHHNCYTYNYFRISS